MIVIADSGSTKADWKLVDSNIANSITTMGFNPVFHTTELISDELAKAFRELNKEAATNVYYYGSGCWDQRRKQVIKDALKQVFGKADILVEHDLLGAARATCGTEPGISCILGTGSNTCLYDGNDVIDNVTNLGYLMGDEGSGTHLGKKLIRAYFYRELPPEIKTAFEEWVPGGQSEILDKVYGEDTPNVYLASFTKFLAEHKDHFYIQRLIYKSFTEFIDRHVRKYEGHLSLPIHFIGSIAYTFQDLLRIILQERHMKPGVFIKKPIDELVKFHVS